MSDRNDVWTVESNGQVDSTIKVMNTMYRLDFSRLSSRVRHREGGREALDMYVKIACDYVSLCNVYSCHCHCHGSIFTVSIWISPFITKLL